MQPTGAHAEVTGWRWWMLAANGQLTSLGGDSVTSTGDASPVWPAGGHMTATCWDSLAERMGLHFTVHDPAPHTPPGDRCECGIRIMETRAALLDALTHDPKRAGVSPSTWRMLGPAYLQDRVSWGVEAVPDVIGQVVAFGRVVGGARRRDPAGTLRAEHARVGTVLHLSPHVGYAAPALREQYPGVRVVVGSAFGLEWLQELRHAG